MLRGRDDFLQFFIDDELQDQISGERDWGFQLWQVEEGDHTLRWVYSKDSVGVSGADAGWIDELEIYDLSSELNAALDTENLAWYVEGDNFWEADDAEFLPGGSHRLQWIYTKDGSVAEGADAGWLDTVFLDPLPDPTEEFNPALDVDETGLAWTPQWSHNSHSFWETEQDGAFLRPGDPDALRSGEIGNDDVSEMVATLDGPGTLTFWRKVSSEEDFDFLDVLVDGELVQGISGEIDWHTASIQIPAGRHEVSWVYSKDEIESAGADSGWVDGVSFVSGNFELYRSLVLAGEADSEATEDIDGDGLINIAEQAFVTDPTEPDRDLAVSVGFEPGNPAAITLTYLRPESVEGFVYVVEQSTDLRRWEPVPVRLQSAEPTGSGLVLVSLRVELFGPRNFVRIGILPD